MIKITKEMQYFDRKKLKNDWKETNKVNILTEKKTKDSNSAYRKIQRKSICWQIEIKESQYLGTKTKESRSADRLKQKKVDILTERVKASRSDEKTIKKKSRSFDRKNK